MASNSKKPDKKLITESKEVQLRSFEKQLKDDIASMLDNFSELIGRAKNSENTQIKQAADGEQILYEISVRAANVVRAGESLMKLVAQLKQFLILNDFSSIGDGTQTSRTKYHTLEEEQDKKLITARDEGFVLVSLVHISCGCLPLTHQLQ